LQDSSDKSPKNQITKITKVEGNKKIVTKTKVTTKILNTPHSNNVEIEVRNGKKRKPWFYVIIAFIIISLVSIGIAIYSIVTTYSPKNSTPSGTPISGNDNKLENPSFTLTQNSEIIGWDVINRQDIEIESLPNHADFVRLTCNGTNCTETGLYQNVYLSLDSTKIVSVKVQCWAMIFIPPPDTVSIKIDMIYYDINTGTTWTESHYLRFINSNQNWQQGLLSFDNDDSIEGVVLQQITVWLILNDVGDIGFDDIQLLIFNTDTESS